MSRLARAIAVAAIVIGSGLLALVFVGVAFLSDFSGEHRINGPFLIAGIAVLVAGLLLAVRVARKSPGRWP